MQQQQTNLTPILLYGGIALGAYFLIIKPLKDIFGKSKERTERTEEVKKLLSSDYWNPEFWNKPNATLLKVKTAEQLATRIKNAHGLFNDNEEAIYGVFRALKTKSQISWIAKHFYEKYKEDLAQFLNNILSNKELQIIFGIIDKLPNY